MKLVPLVGVPSADFKVCRINDNEENEIKRLDETLKDIESGSEVHVHVVSLLTSMLFDSLFSISVSMLHV